jgi:hypothetical protein
VSGRANQPASALAHLAKEHAEFHGIRRIEERVNLNGPDPRLPLSGQPLRHKVSARHIESARL